MAVGTRISQTTASRNASKASKQIACSSQTGSLKRQVAVPLSNSTKAHSTKLPATKSSDTAAEKSGACGNATLNRKATFRTKDVPCIDEQVSRTNRLSDADCTDSRISNKSLESTEENESKNVMDLEESSRPEIEMQHKELDVIDSNLQTVSWFPVGDVELGEFWELKADHSLKSGLEIQSLISCDSIPLTINNGSSSKLEGAVCKEFIANQLALVEKHPERGTCAAEQELSLREPDVIEGLEMKNGLRKDTGSSQTSSSITSEGIPERDKSDLKLTKPSGKLLCLEGCVTDVFRCWRTVNVVIPSVLVMIAVWFCVERSSGDVLGILPPT